MKVKIMIYWASLLPLHFWNTTQDASEKSIWVAWSSLGTIHLCAWERFWTDQTTLGYKGWCFSIWGDNLDLSELQPLLQVFLFSLKFSPNFIYVCMCFVFLMSMSDNIFYHKWLSTFYSHFPCTVLILVVLKFSIGKAWNKHK